MMARSITDQTEMDLKRATAAFGVRDLWRGLLNQAYKFALPMRNTWENQSPGTTKMNEVFDSTAIISLQKFAARLQSELTPIGQEWIDLKMGPGLDRFNPKEKKQLKAKLEAAVKIFFLEIENSNFDLAVAEFFLELGIGTAALLFLEGEDDNLFNFEAVTMAQIGIDSGPFGTVDGVFREHELEARSIERTWTDAEIPAALQDKIDKKPEEKIQLIECTYFDNKIKQYLYKVLWRSRGNSDKNASLLVDRKYEEHPWIIARWVKTAGETWGRGPVLFALPDVKTLNKVKEFVLKNASFAISGVWAVVDDGTFNASNIQIRPGAMIAVAAQGNLARVESNARFDVAQFIIADLQSDIRQTLFDRQLPDPAGSVRSPTEIIERIKQLQQDIGSPFGRVNIEFIRPLVQRGLNILTRKGSLDVPIKLNGKTVRLQVNSPIARTQALNDIEALIRWVAMSREAAGPEAFLASSKVEDIPGFIGEKLGVESKFMRSDDERKEVLEIVKSIAAEGQGIEVGSPENSVAA